MRKIATAAALAGGIFLGACQPVITGNPQVDAILAQAAIQAKNLCGITIQGAQIVALVPDPRAITAAAIATALCSAVLQAQRKKGILRSAGSVGVVTVNIGGSIVQVTVQR